MHVTEHEAMRPQIMIVEDEGIIARDIEQTLEKLGYEVTGQAGSGPEALELASLVRADLVLMDIKIRGEMDGIQTAEQLRQTHRIPVVFLTAHADSDTLARANGTEPFGYVVKPFSEASIKVAIEVALNRHRVHRKAEEKTNWFHTALESISDAIIIMNFDGRIDYMNVVAERLTGWRSSDACGRDFQQVVTLQELNPDSQLGNVKYGVAPDHPVTLGEMRLIDREGVERRVIGSASPMLRPDTDEALGGMLLLREAGVHSEVKDKAGLREMAYQAERRLHELSYALSHDLREPIRNMSCFAQLLAQQHQSLEGNASAYLEMIVTGSRRMDDLLVGLGKYHAASELKRNQIVANTSTCLDAAIERLAEPIAACRAVIETSSMPDVLCNPDALTDLWESLIENAVQFRCDRPLRVEITAEPQGALCQFRIEDNGSGIEPSQTDRIFLLFKKAHDQGRSGSGIGLAICRRIVEQFGGRIWAESKLGKGSQIYFTLPLAPSESDIAEQPQAELILRS